ncbi:PAS domain-containing protein [Undibacterium arcticum]|uniref:PAS domain-containing protein n=1 Tax=Undibacterium arcticum TaxID=1762892 RepID=UPI003619C16B
MTLEINRAALEGAGIRLDDIQGKPFWECRWFAVSKETRDYVRDLVRRASQGEFVRCDIEAYGQAAGEETIMVDFSLLPIEDQNGKIVFASRRPQHHREEARRGRDCAEERGIAGKP